MNESQNISQETMIQTAGTVKALSAFVLAVFPSECLQFFHLCGRTDPYLH